MLLFKQNHLHGGWKWGTDVVVFFSCLAFLPEFKFRNTKIVCRNLSFGIYFQFVYAFRNIKVTKCNKTLILLLLELKFWHVIVLCPETLLFRNVERNFIYMHQNLNSETIKIVSRNLSSEIHILYSWNLNSGTIIIVSL